MKPRFLAALLFVCAASAAAQQLYRWTDETGRVNITDTPPPPNAKGVQKRSASSSGGAADPEQPYALAAPMKDFPVVLYTSPICKEPCAQARSALNRRGVPFREVQVWDEKSNEELKRVSGGNEVPTLLVGRSVQRGFEQGAFDALLDSARYPRTGILPARAQAAPAAPEGYVPPGEREARPQAEPVKPEVEAAPAGPYAPGASRTQKK